jgi:hypothetical protein
MHLLVLIFLNFLLVIFFSIYLAPYFHLRNRSYSSVLICIISSWLIPFAIWPSSVFLAQHFSTKEPACVHKAHPYIIVILCTFFYYIPLLFMLVCYSRIIVNIKNIEVMVSYSILLRRCSRYKFIVKSIMKNEKNIIISVD